jgi:uncharacterized membrane protein
MAQPTNPGKTARLFKSATTTHLASRRIFPTETQVRLEHAIAAGEAQHRGQLRLIIESAMPLRKIWRGIDTRQRALDLFGTFRVWDTEENNGVLLYLNLAERKAELIADRAAARAITDPEWHAIASTMLAAFKRGEFERGTIAAIDAISAELAQAFPGTGTAEENTQPNAPSMI